MSKPKNYQVEITWGLRFWVDVEATSEEEAKEKAYEKWDCSDGEQSSFDYVSNIEEVK